MNAHSAEVRALYAFIFVSRFTFRALGGTEVSEDSKVSGDPRGGLNPAHIFAMSYICNERSLLAEGFFAVRNLLQ